MNAERARRRKLDILVGWLGIIVLGWSAYAYLANQLAGVAVTGVLAAMDTPDRAAACAATASTGFPLRVNVTCRRPHFADTGNSISLDLETISTGTRLYWPFRLDASAAGPLVIRTGAAGNDRATANWSTAALRFDAGWGGLKSIALLLKDADLDGIVALPHFTMAGLTAATIDLKLAPDQTKSGGYELAATLAGIRPVSADGRDLPPIEAAVKLTALDFGGSLGIDPRGAFRHWVASGGAFEIGRVSIATGPIQADVQGALSVSEAGLISGKIALSLKGLDELPALADRYRPELRSAAEKAQKLLTAVTRKIETADGPARTTTLTVRDSVVSFGIVPLAVIPRLF